MSDNVFRKIQTATNILGILLALGAINSYFFDRWFGSMVMIVEILIVPLIYVNMSKPVQNTELESSSINQSMDESSVKTNKFVSGFWLIVIKMLIGLFMLIIISEVFLQIISNE